MKNAARMKSAEGGYAIPTRSQARPRRLRQIAEHEDDEAGQQPEQRIPLLQSAAADELEDDGQQEQGRDGRGDRDSKRRHCSS